MREALFIKKNKDRWTRIQQQPASDPDEMASNFIQLVDDLSYSKTFYPRSKTTRFLNSEASKVYQGIYQNRKEEHNRIVLFCKYDLPLTVRKHHRVLLLSFILFLLFFLVGFYSAKGDDTFVRMVMGNEYVNMTEANIERGDPFGVYKEGNSLLMWLGIMINNIKVSFFMFSGGLLVGYYPIMQLVTEGVRLGAFECMFFNKGLGTKFVLTVFVHGTLEISALIISGAAGIVLGKSFLFPGTVTRLAALKQGAKDGIKIIVGLVPVFILAAFFEGFVTRHTEMPVWLNLCILLFSAVFIIGYFVVYPIWLGNKTEQAHEAA